MRYASIRKMDISNGEGIGISLFVQGCYFHCKNCFNPEAWDFNGGKEWTQDIQNMFLKLADKPYITRLSVLGGEPLARANIQEVSDIVYEFKKLYPQKKVWVYTGFEWNDVKHLYYDYKYYNFERSFEVIRRFLKACDVLVDGQYIDELKDPGLKWRGSSNQRVIDVQKTIKKNKICLY